MKTLASLLTALALALLLAVPVLAGGDGGDTVTKRFKVTLYGDVPKDRAVAVFYATREQWEAGKGEGTNIVFCGQPDEEDQAPNVETVVASDEDCSGGSTYSQVVRLERGAEIVFLFVHGPEDVPEDYQGEDDVVFHSTPFDENFQPVEYETIDDDTTNDAYYDFEMQKGGAGNGADAPGMPGAGAGGMVNGSRPPGISLAAAAAAIPLLAAGGYARRRRG